MTPDEARARLEEYKRNAESAPLEIQLESFVRELKYGFGARA